MKSNLYLQNIYKVYKMFYIINIIYYKYIFILKEKHI